MIQKNNSANEKLTDHIKMLESFSKKAKMPHDLFMKIKKYLENNYQELINKVDEEALLKELPSGMRDEALSYKYAELINKLKLFKENDNVEFIWAIIPKMKKIKVDKDDVVFLVGDFADEFYFILAGAVKLIDENGNTIRVAREGDSFGDYEVLFNVPRYYKAIAKVDCAFMVINKEDGKEIFEKQFLEVGI